MDGDKKFQFKMKVAAMQISAKCNFCSQKKIKVKLHRFRIKCVNSRHCQQSVSLRTSITHLSENTMKIVLDGCSVLNVPIPVPSLTD